jgi:hypothetical protein
MSRMHTFEKRLCDRCRHRSAVKNTPPPSPSFPVPIPPTHHTQHPSANCPGPMISGLLDHVTSSATGCGAPGPWRNPFHSAPPPPPPAQNRLFGLAARGEKGLSLSEGLGKEYMKWGETSVGKTGTQAEGRHVVIRASRG